MTYVTREHLTDWQKQVIYGTILGGSSLVMPKNGKNCFLSMRGSDKIWLEYKSQELFNLNSENPYFKERKYYRWHSKCSPALNEIYSKLYNNNVKNINMDVLNILRDIGLAIWYLECGKIVKKVMSLCGNEVGSQYFNELGLTNSLKEGRLLFDVKSTQKFVNIIGPCIPEFMAFKLYGMAE